MHALQSDWTVVADLFEYVWTQLDHARNYNGVGQLWEKGGVRGRQKKW